MASAEIEQLQQQLRRKCALHCESLSIGSLTIELYRPQDPDTLLDEMLAKSADDIDVRDERLPYWAELWPSSIALATYLVRERPLDPHVKVLELGCGLGLTGIVAGHHTSQVVMTDYQPTVLQFAELNWRHNLTTPFRGEVLDWREPRQDLAADVVLAADVAYESRALEPLVRAFRALTRPGGRILLVEPGRKVAQGFATQIAEQLESRHQVFPIRLTDREFMADADIFIHEFQW
ncbi:MAG: methyltransferase domain-containing protein [Planctomycetota bacterium]|nr:methyltransferase domain-containing protein [Planctomycetota bacterium]